MPVSMSSVAVPTFEQTLGALSKILDKAAAHCAAKKIDPSVILAMRLSPDMLTFTKQVQIACDFAKNFAGRCTGEPPKYPDDEKSFEELKARIAKTLDYVKGFKAADLDAAADKDITFPVGPNSMTLKGTAFLVHFVLPNFYFHATTAYDILRHAGVEIGKRDFLGARVTAVSAAALAPYTVNAFNSSRESENKIHDDAVAGRFGFRGGLVPGVDVYAYMAHLPVARWGRAWLERGVATCRFNKPVYDGEDATVTASESATGLSVSVASHGEPCAAGDASLPDKAPAVPQLGALPPAPPATRPPADERSLGVDTLLGMKPLAVTPDFAARYLADVRETDPLYAREGLMHPGLILRTCNWALMHNVVLGPWIHVGSAIRHLAAGRVGGELTVNARVAANYERKGHRFVELDAVVASDARPIAHITHTAIYRPRQFGA